MLRGAIDIHVHSDPDNVPRSIDGIDVAKLARSNGISRGVGPMRRRICGRKIDARTIGPAISSGKNVANIA